MRVPLQKVPLDDRRRAARILDSLTTESDRKELRGAHFGVEVTPVYRPDLDDVAYWEFEVQGLTTSLQTGEDEAKEFDRGFIIVATGRHDVPLPHFSLDLAPPSRELERFGDVARVVKMDSLCYVAEDKRGQMLGHTGNLPPKLVAAPRKFVKGSDEGWATTFAVGEDGTKFTETKPDGDETEAMRLRRSRDARPLEARSWKSWDEARDGYQKTYGTFLKALAARAEHPWMVEGLVAEFGEGIHSGQTLVLSLLEKGKHKLSGAGAEFVNVEVDEKSDPPRLLLTPKADTSQKDLDFEVTISYRSGTEALRFFIVPEGAPSIVGPMESPLGPTFER